MLFKYCVLVTFFFWSFTFGSERSLLITISKMHNITFNLDTSNKYKTTVTSLDNLSAKHNLVKVRKLRVIHIHRNHDFFELQFNTAYSKEALLLDYKQDPKIATAQIVNEEEDSEILSSTTPNDPGYSSQLAMGVMDFPEAWDYSTGSNTVKVAIFDTGLDWMHPDFYNNIWQNLGEDADGDGKVLQYNGVNDLVFDPGDINGIDDDGNGFIDDFVGWDFNNDDNDPIHTPGNTHGTQVASLVGATGDNNTAVAGSNWEVSLVGCRVDFAWISNSIEAIDYCVANGIDIVNMSYGSSGWGGSTTFENAIADATDDYNILFVAAAGNDNHETKEYPAAWDDVMALAATDLGDTITANTNYGNWIDATATVKKVGFLVYQPDSTVVHDHYIGNGATSTASPLTAGLAALIKDMVPNIENTMIRDIITSTCDNIDTHNPSYIGKLGDGRINAYEALDLIDSDPATPQNFDGSWYNNHPKITWDANTEADLTKYYILKSIGGSYSIFDSTTNTYYVDDTEDKYAFPYTKTYVYYKAQACDVVKNTSAATAYERFAVNAPEQSENELADALELEKVIPDNYELTQNYPNPFNPVTQIKFGLPEPGFTTLKIYNINGQLVTTLIDKNMDAGYHFTSFDGATLSSGIYFYELTSASFRQLKRMLLIK